MSLMVLMIEPITRDWVSSAWMPSAASCIEASRPRITLTVWVTTSVALRALASVPSEVLKATSAASATACSWLT
ncbi:hypothetical protein D3C76_1776330 [compost metagenome]